MGERPDENNLQKNNRQKPTKRNPRQSFGRTGERTQNHEGKANTDWSLGDRVWADLFDPLCTKDGDLAERAAKLFMYLLMELENEGAKGATNAAICIENALDRIFPYTPVGQTCKILFLVSLGKDFPAKPDSLAVLSEAMKRTRAALKRASDEQPRQRKRSRR